MCCTCPPLPSLVSFLVFQFNWWPHAGPRVGWLFVGVSHFIHNQYESGTGVLNLCLGLSINWIEPALSRNANLSKMFQVWTLNSGYLGLPSGPCIWHFEFQGQQAMACQLTYNLCGLCWKLVRLERTFFPHTSCLNQLLTDVRGGCSMEIGWGGKLFHTVYSVIDHWANRNPILGAQLSVF